MANTDDLDKLGEIQYKIENNEPSEVVVLGKTFKIKDMPRWTLQKIVKLGIDMDKKIDFENANSVSTAILKGGSSDVKAAAYILLCNPLKIMLFHWIYWRWLNMKYNSETFNGILDNGLEDKETLFFLKNLILIAKTTKSRTAMMTPLPKQ